MIASEIRQHIHQLIDEANETQLDAVLKIFETTGKYSQQELNSFYERVRLFEEGGSKGYSIEESHSVIRAKYKQSGL